MGGQRFALGGTEREGADKTFPATLRPSRLGGTLGVDLKNK